MHNRKYIQIWLICVHFTSQSGKHTQTYFNGIKSLYYVAFDFTDVPQKKCNGHQTDKSNFVLSDGHLNFL